MSKNSVEVVESRLFAGTVADEIAATLGDLISEKGSATLVLSGGSTPAIVYRALTVPPRVDDIDWSKVIFFWGDERYVPPTDPQSNFHMVELQLINHLTDNKPKIIPINTSLSTPQDSARDYEKKIKETLKLDDKEIPRFDLMLLGIGEDGHIASLFPGSPLNKETQHIVAAAKHPSDGSDRITMTPSVIINAANVIFIVTDDKKSDIVKRVLEGTNEEDEALPARLYRKAKGRVTFFLDSAAAVKLSKDSLA